MVDEEPPSKIRKEGGLKRLMKRLTGSVGTPSEGASGHRAVTSPPSMTIPDTITNTNDTTQGRISVQFITQGKEASNILQLGVVILMPGEQNSALMKRREGNARLSGLSVPTVSRLSSLDFGFTEMGVEMGNFTSRS